MDANAPPRIFRDERRFATPEEAMAKLRLAQPLPVAVQRLFKQPRFEQGTDEWLLARWNFLTASVASAPLGQFPWQSRQNLFHEKVNPPVLVNRTNVHMQRGKDNEDVAAFLYERITGRTIIDFGMLLHYSLYELMPAQITDSMQWFRVLCGKEPSPVLLAPEVQGLIQSLNWFAGSPDGVTTDGRLVEIKCPRVLKREATVYYAAQIQLNMEVMDLDVCDFFEYDVATGNYSYIEVHRDRDWFRRWHAAVQPFWNDVLLARATGVIPPEYSTPSRKRAYETETTTVEELKFND